MREPDDDLALRRRLKDLPQRIEPPEDLWPAVRARLAPRRTAWWRRPRTLRIAAGLALVATLSGWLVLDRRAGTTWRVADAAGGTFAPGESLATRAGERVRLTVGSIGQVEVAGGSRVRLLDARATRHRLALDAGAIEARISAPPRLFMVETPAGTVVDLGCAYTLSVGGGVTALHVTQGWVAFERDGRESLVPAGFRYLSRGRGDAGLPVREEPDTAFAQLVRRFDAGGQPPLDSLLRAAGRGDAVTLWHLLGATDGEARERVYRRLAALVPPPGRVSREALLRLDRLALRLWWLELPGTLPIYPSWTTRLWMWWLWLTE
jgi:hypothetical protein